jgi:DNA repair protein RadD
MLRPYQSEAHKAVMAWVRKSVDPCLVDAPTGSGKSHIISAIAGDLHAISGSKKVLCLAPSAELVTQNREKYLATGNPASIMSASAGANCMRHPVVFGTPGTVKNRIRAFGRDFCAVVLDEAHRITPTVKAIIERLKEQNPKLRVIGLSATPYRLGSGYIYEMNEDGQPMGEHACKDPYFTALVYSIQAKELIDNGYLTAPVIGEIGADNYETLGLEVNRMGNFNSAEVDKAFHGHGRKTSRIIADVVAKSRDRNGVMIFAATVQHAQECMASLPPGLSAIVTGATSKDDRRGILQRFKAKEIKYLVNVSVLTTGFDAPHVDVIAILRATESVSLLQQIIGRGLRIDDDKDDCLVLDYAENLERHCPDGDIFNPEIKAGMASGESAYLEAECAECGTTNTFSARKNPDQFETDKYGYFVDLARQRIETDHGPMPAHYGRRCQGLIKRGATHVQCAHRWTSKECPHCGADNDIAARYCVECRGEIIDPNEKLRIEFKEFKKDPTRIQTDKVVSWETKPVVSRKGNECLVVTFQTEYRSFSVWYHPYVERGRLRAEYLQLMDATESGVEIPHTVTYQKDGDSGFYRVFDFNRGPDEI